MADRSLATYLNDHLAGAATVLELLGDLERAHAGTDVGRFLAALRAEIAADGQTLEQLMDRLHIARSKPRLAATWLAEKGTRLMLRLDDPAGGDLRLLETLDILATGIEGKRGLWRALAAVSDDLPDLRGTDYGHLERRAEEQRAWLEGVRLAAARAALAARS